MIRKGRQTVISQKDISIISASSLGGKKEGQGSIGCFFDRIIEDSTFGETSWEKAESKFVKEGISLVLKKADMKEDDIDYIISGDLLNQTSGSTYGLVESSVPYIGIYGACSTIGEGMSLASMILESGGAKNIIVNASSHFCTAEKQFRFPLDLGTQRPPSSTWTVTGNGSFILSTEQKSNVRIKAVTTGRIIDMGIKDANNMGAVMAPAACDVILGNFRDLGIGADYYDLIITGDLGTVGREILIETVRSEGYDISENITDCGIEIFDNDLQDTHCGGSGCACSAITFAGYFYPRIKKGELRRVLFIPTGALMSPSSVQQGESIPAIAHGLVIEYT